jgi:hypothetical protein
MLSVPLTGLYYDSQKAYDKLRFEQTRVAAIQKSEDMQSGWKSRFDRTEFGMYKLTK